MVSRNGKPMAIDDRDNGSMCSLLPGYVAALVLDQKTQARFPLIAQHLDQCEECRDKLSHVLHMLKPLYDGNLVPAEDVHTPNLAFLKMPAPAPVRRQSYVFPVFSSETGVLSGLVLDLGKQIEELHTYWHNGLRSSALLQARGSILVNYEPDPQATAGASISVQLIRNERDAACCDLKFTLMLPEDVQAPNGIIATLQVDDQVWTQKADEWDPFIFPASITPHAQTVRITTEIIP